MMKKRRFAICSRMVPLLIALILVLVPIVVQASEGEASFGFGNSTEASEVSPMPMRNGEERAITFVFQNGAGFPNIYAPQTTTIQVPVGENPEPPRGYEPRRGFYFAGWYKGIYPDWVPYHPGAYEVGDYDRTFTARFNLLWWYITFIVEEGGMFEGETYIRERDGQRLPGNHLYTPQPIIPNTQARPGYVFTGWYAVAEDGTRVRIGDCLTELGSNHPVLNVTVDFREHFIFVATFEPYLKDLLVVKEWDESVPEQVLDEIEYITIELLQNGEPFVPERVYHVLSDDWELLIPDLRMYDTEGYPIEYTIREIAIDYDGNGTFNPPIVLPPEEPEEEGGPWTITIINSYIEYIGHVENPVKYLQVTKHWVGDTSANRPDYILVQLVVNGSPISGEIITITPDANGYWIGVFEGLPVRDDNDEAFVYTIREINVPEDYYPRVDPLVPPTDGSNVYNIRLTNTLAEEGYGGPNGGNGGDPVGGGNGGNGPLTGDFASTAPLLAGLLFAMSGLLGGTSLRRKLKK